MSRNIKRFPRRKAFTSNDWFTCFRGHADQLLRGTEEKNNKARHREKGLVKLNTSSFLYSQHRLFLDTLPAHTHNDAVINPTKIEEE